MKILLLLLALFTAQMALAQTDTLPDRNNPAKQVATPNAGSADNTPTAEKQAYKIEPKKNAETVEQIKLRTAKREQKTIRKYKGKKADTTANSKKQ